MILNSDDIKKIQFKKDNVVVKKVNLSIGHYYAKYCTIQDAFRELLGKKVFDLVGIKCPLYHYVEQAHCVISEDIKNFDTFYNPFDLEMNGYTLKDIKEKLLLQQEQGKFTNIDHIYFQIDVMHFIDILLSNIDRHISNFGFSLKDDNTGYLVVYDNADMLNEFEKATRPMAIETSEPLSFVFTSKRAEAKEFINNVDEGTYQYFMRIYEMLAPNRLFSMIKIIEIENNIKFHDKISVFKSYIRNYLMIGKILKQNNKIKKK